MVTRTTSSGQALETRGVTREEVTHLIAGRARAARDLWRGRNEQVVGDRAMYNMTYRQVPRGQELYLSNEAMSLVNKCAEILSAKWPVIRMPITTQQEPERRRMNDAERFLDGVLREVSIRYRRRGRNAWLYDLSWYTCMGMICIYPSIREGNGGEVQFRADLWDPIQVYPVYGDDGLQELYRIYRMTPIEALTMAEGLGYEAEHLQGSIQKEHVEIINAFWVEDEQAYNAVLIDGKLVKPRTKHEEWGGKIPVLMYPAGGLPYRGFDWEQNGGMAIPDWPATWGQPIFSANRNVYKTLDKVLTWLLRITRRFSMPIGISETRDAAPLIEPGMDLDSVKLINAEIGEKFNWVNPPGMPQERRELLSYLGGAAQRGGLSNIAFGELALELPGVAVERLLAATKSTLTPYVETAEFAISELCMYFLEMYRKGNHPKVKLNVKQTYGGITMQVFQEEFAASRIPDTNLVLSTLPMGLPDRRLQNMSIARIAIPGNEPLLDDVTVAEEFLDIQDYELVQDRIAEMKSAQDPAFQLISNIEALMQRKQNFIDSGKPEMADMVQRVIDLRLQQFSVETGGASAPPGPVAPRSRELSPQVAPPEATGLSPDEIRPQPAQAGVPDIQGRLASLGLSGPRG